MWLWFLYLPIARLLTLFNDIYTMMWCCANHCALSGNIFFVPYLGPLFDIRAHQKRIALIVWLKSTFLVVEKCGKNNISTKWKKELTFRPSEIFQHCFLIDFFSVCSRVKFLHCFLIMGRFRAILRFSMMQSEEAQVTSVFYQHQRN